MKTPMNSQDNNSELDALIDACLDGRLSDAEAERLSRWIEESSEARQRYWELASVHGLIEQSMQNASLKAATGAQFITPTRTARPSRRPRFTGVAAGIVIGMFCASLAWAYAVPLVRPPHRQTREIAFQSFEDPEMKWVRGFPTKANQWFGRILPVPGEDGMPSVNGSRVGKFDTWTKSKFTYTRYLIDLNEYTEPDEAHIRSIEVEASFFTSSSHESSVFQIRLGALSQAPTAVRPIWNNHETLFDTILQHVGRNYITEPGRRPGWHKLRATIEIPPGARSVVISLAAGNVDADSTTSDHYVDAVRVHLVDTLGPLD